MSKERRTVTVEKEVDDYLGQSHVNASGLVNDLVKRHMNGDDTDGAIREFRIRQLEEEATEYANRAERKQSEAKRLREVAQEKQDDKRTELESVVEQLRDVPRDPNNPAVKAQAQKVGMEPEELLDELPDDKSGGLNSL